MSDLDKQIAEMEQKIQEKQFLVNAVRSQAEIARPLLKQCEGIPPEELTVELQNEKQRFDNAIRCLAEQEKSLQEMEVNLWKLKEESKAVKCLDGDDGASIRSDTSTVEMVDLSIKRSLLDLKNKFEQTKEDLEWGIEDKEEELNKVGDSRKQQVQDDIRTMRRALQRATITYTRQVKELYELAELEKQRVVLERQQGWMYTNAGDKVLLESGESEKEQETATWVEEQNAVTEEPENKDNLLEATPTPSAETGAEATIAPVDKDTLMMQLMKSQLTLLEKSHGTYAEKKLPEFGGDPGEWGAFKAAFERTNKKFKFDDSENLPRLQQALKGKAKDSVKHLMFTPTNVSKVMEVLEQRYGRPEFIIDFLMEKARNCKRPEMNKPESIVEFGTVVDYLVSNIKAYDESEYLHNKQLVMELVDKLPGIMKGNWFRYLNTDKSRKTNLTNFSTWMTEETNIAILQVKPKVQESKSEEKSRGSREVGSMNATGGSEASSPGAKCNVCGGRGHQIDTCFKLKKKTLDERWAFAKEARVCFGCLKGGHQTKDCEVTKVCGKDGCTMKHHPLLHSTRRPRTGAAVPASPQTANETSSSGESDDVERISGVIGLTTHFIEGTDGPLPIVPVRVKGNDGKVVRLCYALLDTGCTRTLINEEMARLLKLSGRRINYTFRVMAGKTVRNEEALKVDFQISGRYKNAKMWNISDAVTVKDIGLSPYTINVEAVKEHWPHLRRYKGPSLVNVVPEIVIGGDNGYLMMHRELLYSTPDMPVAMRTTLGWFMMGKLRNVNVPGSAFAICGGEESTLDNLIRESFKLEDYGVKGDGDKKLSLQDKRALEILESTTLQRADGRWETGLLWKDELPFPESTYDQAYSRLRKTEARMKRDLDFAQVYSDKIEEYVNKKYIKKLSWEEAERITPRTCFIPHFGVVNPNKPGKFRLVFDAAAKSDGISMNDRLLTGPDRLRPLPAILWNFRCHPVVICGDIEDMFHRVYIREEDRRAQQFLWRDGDGNKKPDVYQMEVMIFGATSSPSTAIFVKDRNAEKYEPEFPDAVSAIKSDMYCDDFLGGAKTVDDAIRLREEITKINLYGGFVMKKWISNNDVVMKSIPEDLRLDGNKPLAERGLWNAAVERVLGLWWDPSCDEFTFKLNFAKVKPEVLEGRTPTKREMCSLLMSIFDPLGFISHFKVKGLILFQEAWKSGVGWDDYIPDTIHVEWKSWLERLQGIKEIGIPRCYNLPEGDLVQLHTLVDASSEAMAAVCYLRIEEDNHVHVVFISSKVRVAPLKKSTIPRLELEAAVMGSKLASTILKELQVIVTKCYYWSDSSTVLSWIKSESSRFKEYVANRISKIQDLTSPADWRWIPTAENTADDGTRSGKDVDFSSECRWLQGPEFLRQDKDLWPTKVVTEDETVVALAIGGEGVEEAFGGGEHETTVIVPNPERFSSYYRLVRATAAVIACRKFWHGKWLEKKKQEKRNAEAPWKYIGGEKESCISTDDLVAAQKVLLLEAQRGVTTGGKKKPLKFQLFHDKDGVIRVKGRLGKASCVGESARVPIYLPAKNKIADLIIDEEHRMNGHVGRNTVYNNLRQMYWIEDGRQAVRRAWTRCYHCRLRKAKPVFPEMGNLPDYRLAGFEPPFTYTGTDMFGPLEVTVGRRHEKRWGMLFTCMVTRAIHSEITAGLSADDTLLALSRFVDTRGLPRHFYSDNGTNYVAVAKEVKKRQKYLGTDWHFIPPASPHFGGAWETMVKQVKSVLMNILKERFPRDQVLQTAFKAIENIVNTRPLAYVSGDVDEPEALTPNHFLRGIGLAVAVPSSQGAISGSDFLGEVDSDRERWGKLWEKAQVLANKYWQRWSKEVLPELLKKNKWNVSAEPVRVGDVVILVDEAKQRNLWVKAIVTKVFAGEDGVVRVVEVTNRDPETDRRKTYRRTVAKVCPTGIRCCDLESTL